MEELREEAEELKGLGIREIVDHYEEQIRGLDGPPVLIGHSFGDGRVDLLVNNVGGVRLRLDGFLEVSDADFETSLQLNLFPAGNARGAMFPRGGGAIVSVVSVNAFSSPTGW